MEDIDRHDALLKIMLFVEDTTNNNNDDDTDDGDGGSGTFGKEARPDVLPRLLAVHQELVRR